MILPLFIRGAFRDCCPPDRWWVVFAPGGVALERRIPLKNYFGARLSNVFAPPGQASARFFLVTIIAQSGQARAQRPQ